jgi:PAS domain S-box-containing protein
VNESAVILIVEDDPHLLAASARLLQKAGYRVLEATTGQEGLHLAKEIRPDLVLLDVVLPDVDGFEVCERIKANDELARAFVVMLSSTKTASDSQAEGLEAGADGYIVRPISNRELVARVQALLRVKRVEDALQAQMHKLGARVKELNCLYGVSRLIEQSGASLTDILQGTAELLPPAWQYPEIACARAVLQDQEFRTGNFRETAWRLACDISVRGEPFGCLEVRYLEERPVRDEGPFLKEEREVLNSVAERLGRVIERLQAEEELRWYEVVVSTIADPMSYVDKNYVYRMANDTYARYAQKTKEEIVGLSVAELLGAKAFEEHVKPHLDRCLAGEEVHYEAWFDVPAAGSRSMDVGYYPVRGDGGSVIGAAVSSRDITERVQMEEALRRERDLVAQITQTSPVGIVVMDRQGKITFANEQVKKVTGLTDGDMIGRAYGDPTWRVTENNGSPLSDEVLPFPRVMSTGRPIYNLEHSVELAGRPRFFISMNAAPLFDDQGEVDGVVVTVRDITERKQAQDDLLRYADRLRVLHEIDQAILAARSVEETVEVTLHNVRRLVPCMRASVALFDPEASDLLLLAVYSEGETKLGMGGSVPLAWAWFVQEIRQGQIYRERDILALSSSSPWVAGLRDEGVRGYVSVPLFAQEELFGSLSLGLSDPETLSDADTVIVKEVADLLAVGVRQARLHEQVQQYAAGLERRVAERTAELRASETRFRTLFEQAAVGIALVDMAGAVIESNPAFQNMLGCTGEGLRGRTFGELFHDPGNGSLAIDLPIESINGGQDCCTAEGRYVGRAGQPAWAYVTASLVRGEDDEPQFGIYMVEDITERKRAQAALIQAEKLALAGKLSASLAHEINNPLQSVIGCLGLAQETLAEGNDATEFLEVGLEELRRVARIVAQLRDMYRPSRLEERQHTEVNGLLKQVLTLSRKRCEEQGVDVVWQPESDLPYLFLVPDQIQQVFLNLVLNAVDAMPEGGRLQIQTKGTQRLGGVRISFSDSGVGIPADVLPHVFDPFYSTKLSGLGLGLFISKDIVEQHGGRIDVEDGGGEGTTFTVWLPAAAGGDE